MGISAVIVGAGQRGFFTFGRYAVDHPDQISVVGVVDPDEARRDRLVGTHSGARSFATLDEWLSSDIEVDAVIIASPDRTHFDAALAAIDAGYHVLLEKPMAATPQECVQLVEAAEQSDSVIAVAHVLRYTPFFATLHDVVASGDLGEIVTVAHRENVSAFHMAHSFVRGNWSRAAESTPMIVQKCCHDFDILQWNLGESVATVSSVGSLLHFRPDKAPEGATDRCTDPCPVADCPYDARRYLDPRWTGWPVHVITDDLSHNGRHHALRSGPWGRCAYRAGSDVVDHQVVSMQLESGASVTLTMHGHSTEETRTMRYDGSRATLRARFGARSEIALTNHATRTTRTVAIPEAVGGHGGGDTGVMAQFVAAVAGGEAPPTSIEASLESHLLAFAAERSRVESRVILMSDYRKSMGL